MKLEKALYGREEVLSLIIRAIKQDREFQAQVLRVLPVLDDDDRQNWIENPESLGRTLAGGLCPPEQVPTPEPPIDTIICVNRSIRPVYPNWMKTVMHPELESTGPAEYNIADVEQWLHDGQKGGKWIKGEKIYTHLKDTDMLKTCLGLRDLEEIKGKGIVLFRKHFQGKAVFGWKSVVRYSGGSLYVPWLYEDDGEVVLGWSRLGSGWSDSSPALRLAK